MKIRIQCCTGNTVSSLALLARYSLFSRVDTDTGYLTFLKSTTKEYLERLCFKKIVANFSS